MGDRAADGVGHMAVVGTDDGLAVERVEADEGRTAADENHGQVVRAHPHRVDGPLNVALDDGEGLLDEDAREVGDRVGVPGVQKACGDGDVGGGEGGAAKDQGLLGKQPPDGSRSDGDADAGVGDAGVGGGCGVGVGGAAADLSDEGAAADADRDQVRHPEVGAQPGQLGGVGRLAGIAAAQRAHVGRRAADVHDERVLDAGEEAGTSDAVGRAGGEGPHREARGELRRHERPVVLAEEEGAGDAERR